MADIEAKSDNVSEINTILEGLGRDAGRNVMRRLIIYGYDVDDLDELVEDECELFRLGLAEACQHDREVAENAFRYWLIQEGKALAFLVDTAGHA
jgi:hypothetical protein